MKISIKTLKGELFQVLAESGDTIGGLKQKITDIRPDLSADRQKLIHSGKVLKDEQTVSELGLSEADFIVCMVSKEVAKKPAVSSTPAPAAVPAIAPVPPVPASTATAPASRTQPNPPTPSAVSISTETLQNLMAMTGLPEEPCRAALSAANGNPDMAFDYLSSGLPFESTQRQQAPVSGGSVSIESLRQHPQFNQLKQLIQSNPAAISQVLDAIGQQNPELLAAIHANNDAFIAMMNEPITDTPAPAQPPATGGMFPAVGGNPMADPAQMIQMLATMPPAQRTLFAQTLGLTPEQLEGFMQMMGSLPPGELQNILGGMGGGGMGGRDPPGVIRLTEEEMAAVNRLMALGFSQQQAAQAYLACDKNETLAANLLFEGGWADDDGGDFGGYGGDAGDGDQDDDMYS